MLSRNMAVSLAVVIFLLTPLAYYLYRFDYRPRTGKGTSDRGNGFSGVSSSDRAKGITLEIGQQTIFFQGGRHIVSLRLRNHTHEPFELRGAGSYISLQAEKTDGAGRLTSRKPLSALTGVPATEPFIKLPGRCDKAPPPTCVFYIDAAPLLSEAEPGEYRFRLRLEAGKNEPVSNVLPLRVEFRR